MERKTWQVYKKVKKYFYGFQVGSHGVFFYTCHSFGEQKAPFTAGREINV
jgi:hypothetical protein